MINAERQIPLPPHTFSQMCTISIRSLVAKCDDVFVSWQKTKEAELVLLNLPTWN